MRFTPAVLNVAGFIAVVAALYCGAAALHSAQGVTNAIRSNARTLSSISEEEAVRVWPHFADLSREVREQRLRLVFAEPLHDDMARNVAWLAIGLLGLGCLVVAIGSAEAIERRRRSKQAPTQ